MNFKITELNNFNWIWKRRVLKQVLRKIFIATLHLHAKTVAKEKERKRKEKKKKKNEWSNINENEEQD